MKIPIRRTTDQQRIAEVTFNGGGPLTATAKISKIEAGTNEELKILRDAVLKFKNFSGNQVYTSQGHVPIWRGFWGWIGGLRLVLPSIGFEMDSAGIDWP